MSSAVNFLWPQGEDVVLEFIYKEGGRTAAAVNLSAGYSARMDIFLPSTRQLVHTLTSGAEISLGTGQLLQPNIVVTLPRTLLMTGGPVFPHVDSLQGLGYDLFLRNTATDKQVKVVRGKFTVERSGTLWV